ncbi:MAG TPA: hypothetical protein PLV85_22295, partial [Polyangiaceae bacterium]|nr:hypothetical protein [Polyangiaceae bacterium]
VVRILVLRFLAKGFPRLVIERASNRVSALGVRVWGDLVLALGFQAVLILLGVRKDRREVAMGVCLKHRGTARPRWWVVIGLV